MHLKPRMKRRQTLVYLRILSTASLGSISARAASIQQTNFGNGGNDIPGGDFETQGNLLSTHLSSASRDGTFYREDFGYPVDLSRLYDGELGSLGSTGLGGDGRYTVMPNHATLQFDFDGSYDVSSIRTYASWDSGRSGQEYTVKYASSDAPSTFVTLYEIERFNNDDSVFPLIEGYDPNPDDDIDYYYRDDDPSSTLVELTSSSGVLASDVVSLQFVFSGYQNSGTAFREFQVSAVPEPSSLLPTGCLIAGGLLIRRRGKKLT